MMTMMKGTCNCSVDCSGDTLQCLKWRSLVQESKVPSAKEHNPIVLSTFFFARKKTIQLAFWFSFVL
jgi:hypothetical protein